MAIYSQVPETSAVYTIVAPDGARAVLNDDTDPDYVGTFGTDGITGLDDAEIRENAWDLVEADGGVHGPFWLGRRPVTMSVDVLGTSPADRNEKMEKLKRSTNALRADGILSWTTPNSVGPDQQLSFRRQQPRRWTGNWLKTCFLALVSADPRIYSTTLHTQSQLSTDGDVTWVNSGDYFSPPSLKINGPGDGPLISNGSRIIALGDCSMTTGEYRIIDLVQRTVVDQDGANKFSEVSWSATTWWQLSPGNNSISLGWFGGGNDSNSTLVGNWRDAWV